MATMLQRMKTTVLGDKCTNQEKKIINKNIYNELNARGLGVNAVADKISYLMSYYDKYKNDIKTLADIHMKTRDECTYNNSMKRDLEVINLVFAHKMARAEIDKFGKDQGEMPNKRYPRFKNTTLAYLNEYSPAEDPENLVKIYDGTLKGDFEVEEAAGGKKRKYKRKTNKRKTNKRKTNKRKTNKKRTKK